MKLKSPETLQRYSGFSRKLERLLIDVKTLDP